MWAAKLKLGFMTNYTWTVFIRRAMIGDDWVLFFSDAIHHTVKSKPGTSDTTVSVRECMLYYLKLAAGEQSDWSLESEEREPLEQWVKIIERDSKTRSKAFPTTFLPQQLHRIPSGASLRPPTPTTGKTMQLPHHPRSLGQGPKQSDSATAKRSEYTDVGELSEYEDFYKFSADGQVKMKYQDQWAMDQNDKSILYHDGDKLCGHFQRAAATPGLSQGTRGKGKAKAESDGPPTTISSSTSNSQDGHSQSRPSRVSSNTQSKPVASKYTYIGPLPTGWKSHKHKEGSSSVDLPKSQWREFRGYYYHDGKMLQGKAP